MRLGMVLIAFTMMPFVSGCGGGGVSSAGQTPSTEASFIQIIANSQQESRNAENDMQKGGVKNRRDSSICSVMANLTVSDWVGKVKGVGANSDGKGTLEIEIADDIILKTWNNEISDGASNTLIKPSDPLFAPASSLKAGQAIRFSGSFLRGNGSECIEEGSITLSGKLREPEFIFKFSSVSS